MKTSHLAYTVARWAFFLASLVFLAVFAKRAFVADGQRLITLLPHAVPETLLAAVAFASTAIFSSVGWRVILAQFHPLPGLAVARVFCLTQLAKYLPGNVGHHVGRVFMAKRELGIAPATSIQTIAQEAALVCLAALVTAAVCYRPEWARTRTLLPINADVRLLLVAIIAAGLLALTLANQARSRLATRVSPLGAWLLRASPTWPTVARSLPAYLAVYGLNGVALLAIASGLTKPGWSDIFLLTGSFSLSWILGFLLPGAPGGLGVRETAFILLLGSAYQPSISLALAVLSRAASVGADLLIFVCGMLLPRYSPTRPAYSSQDHHTS